MTRQRLLEVKRRLDGTEARFDCELLLHTASVVVAVFPFKDGHGAWIDSYGLFWRRRPYLCYYMVPRVLQTDVRVRFDIIRDMCFDAGEVSYTDLLLDLWVERGALRWEDEDDVEAFDRSGRLRPADRLRIQQGRDLLTRRHASIITGVRKTLSGLGRLS